MLALNTIETLFDLWAKNGRSDVMANGHQVTVRAMFNQLENRPFRHFLDIGCGNGWVVRAAADQSNCLSATGIDLSHNMILLAKQRSSQKHEHYICDDFLCYPFEQTYDVIFSMEVFYYFSDIRESLEKVYRLMTKQSVFMLGIDYYAENIASHHWPEMLGVTMQCLSKASWKKLCCLAGFKQVGIKQIRDPLSEERWKREVGSLLILCQK